MFTERELLEEERDSLKSKLRQHYKNLARLEERAAKYTIDTPISLLNEIDEVKERIERDKAHLEEILTELEQAPPEEPEEQVKGGTAERSAVRQPDDRRESTPPPTPASITIGGSVGPGAAIGPGAQVQAQVIAGGDITVGSSTNEVADAFAKIYQAIEAKSFADEKTAQEVKEAVEIIKSENEKGDEANETSLRFSFNMLAQVAPDIFDVVVSTLTNPVLSISTVVRKIAQRAKEEQT
jgi:hypothetical protein